MSPLVGRPSFWPEPRDPWAWQRALRALCGNVVPDPTPCWKSFLRPILPRSAVAGMFGWKVSPHPGTVLGSGLLVAAEGGWALASGTLELAQSSRLEFPALLADWLLRRSFWLRLTVRRMAEGRWQLANGIDSLCRRSMRPGIDLLSESYDLNRCHELRLGNWAPKEGLVRMPRATLAPLHAPLHLLMSLGLLDKAGFPVLPADIADDLIPPTPAALLRRITNEESDLAGFVPFDRAATRLGIGWLYTEFYAGPAWSDSVFERAFKAGSIEVHEWAPGQPRHGRGFLGDRSRKLVRWTVHDDFTLSRYPREQEHTP